MKRLLFVWFVAFFPGYIKSQILHTERFNVILDTTKTVQGSIIPDFEFQNLRRDLIEFENLADMSIRFGESALTVANKIELARFGDETFLSGGYMYGEFRKILQAKLSLEMFGQVHWADPRGMEKKYALGTNIRWRLVNKQNLGFYVALGPFYEYERWNFDGVRASRIGESNVDRITETLKLGSYASFKFSPFDKIFLDVSIYYQSGFDEFFSSPRSASSSGITYQISDFIGLALIYQNIYDPEPTVPIDKLYHHIISGLEISF